MMRVYFQVEMEDLREIESELGMTRDKTKLVLKNAINKTAKEVEQRMSSEAKKKYRYESGRVGDIRSANKITQATAKTLTATIRATSGIKEPKHFVLKPDTYFPGGRGAPSWVRSKVLRNGKLHKMALRPDASGDKYKAFVVKYPNKGGNDHIAFAQRVPGSRMQGKNKEAIKSLYSPSIPKMEETVYMDSVHDDVNDMLMRNIQIQIVRFLK